MSYRVKPHFKEQQLQQHEAFRARCMNAQMTYTDTHSVARRLLDNK